MNSQEQARALQQLDRLYVEPDTFSDFLGVTDHEAKSRYKQAKQLLETQNPGLRIHRMRFATAFHHVLAAC